MTKPLLVLVALATVMVAALPHATADAQFQVTEIDPPDGGELDVPPEFVHLCFSQAANGRLKWRAGTPGRERGRSLALVILPGRYPLLFAGLSPYLSP